jgi:5'(3')-deoxyribonucleotidase
MSGKETVLPLIIFYAQLDLSFNMKKVSADTIPSITDTIHRFIRDDQCIFMVEILSWTIRTSSAPHCKLIAISEAETLL